MTEDQDYQPKSLQAMNRLELAVTRAISAINAERNANDAILPRIETLTNALESILPPVANATPPNAVESTLNGDNIHDGLE